MQGYFATQGLYTKDPEGYGKTKYKWLSVKVDEMKDHELRQALETAIELLIAKDQEIAGWEWLVKDAIKVATNTEIVEQG